MQEQAKPQEPPQSRRNLLQRKGLPIGHIPDVDDSPPQKNKQPDILTQSRYDNVQQSNVTGQASNSSGSPEMRRGKLNKLAPLEPVKASISNQSNSFERSPKNLGNLQAPNQLPQ